MVIPTHIAWDWVVRLAVVLASCVVNQLAAKRLGARQRGR